MLDNIDEWTQCQKTRWHIQAANKLGIVVRALRFLQSTGKVWIRSQVCRKVNKPLGWVYIMPSGNRAAVTSLLWWMSRCACARQMTYLETWCCWLFYDIQYRGVWALLKFIQVFNLPWSGWEISENRQTSHLTHFSSRSRQVEHLNEFHQGTKPLVLNIMKKSTTSRLEVCHLPSTSTSGHSSQQAGHCSSVATGHDLNSLVPHLYRW